jgi:hypothetical protein
VEGNTEVNGERSHDVGPTVAQVRTYNDGQHGPGGPTWSPRETRLICVWLSVREGLGR